MKEAVSYYLSLLPSNTTKILYVKKVLREGQDESLGHYFRRLLGHLLNGVRIFEVSEEGVIENLTLLSLFNWLIQ